MRVRVAGFAVAVVVLACICRVAVAEDPVKSDDATLRDFMIQNMCLDSAGAVAIGVSPIDDDPRCAGQRDLTPGEVLPYHKHDHPGPTDATAPTGYQRHDSFPVETAGLGTVVEHTFDFGAGEGRRFGVFDASDGGDIALFGPGRVSIGATQDPSSGFLLWIGECQGLVTAEALTHSWLVAEFDPAHPGAPQGETVARLNRAHSDREACPARFVAAYTDWAVRPVRYRTAPGQGAAVTLTTLVSEHYSGDRRDKADQVERFYFTRELGGTRWEAWANRNGNAQYSPAVVAEAAARFSASGRCSPAEPPGGGAAFVMIDCREWTRIVPPMDPAGDRPGFFLDAIRKRPNAPAFFAAPGEARPR